MQWTFVRIGFSGATFPANPADTNLAGGPTIFSLFMYVHIPQGACLKILLRMLSRHSAAAAMATLGNDRFLQSSSWGVSF